MEDYTETIKKHNKKYALKFKQNKPNTLQHPFRAVICGPSNSGKTMLALNLLINKKCKVNFDFIVACVKSTEEPIYRYLYDMLTSIEEKIREDYEVPDDWKLFEFCFNVADLPALEDIDPQKQNLIVIDDMVQEKHQELIQEHYLRGRKRNCSYLYLTQSYYGCPKMIRLNCNYFCFFALGSKKEMALISSDVATDIEPSEFRRILTEATSKPHHFLLLDNTADPIQKLRPDEEGKIYSRKYRQCFDKCCVFRAEDTKKEDVKKED